MRYMLSALPLVGLAVGLALWGWVSLCRVLGFGAVLFAAGVTALPTLVTGGIHIDGFCDTVDALHSHAEPARKLAILKDPHPGAFAVVYTALYYLGYFALASELTQTNETAMMLTLLHAMSRCGGAFAALRFPLAGEGGMLATCRQAAKTAPAQGLVLAAFALCAAGAVCASWGAGLAMAVIAALCTAGVRRMSIREYGGMRGDLVGYLIAVSELAMLAGMILTEGVKGL